jgi:hypothetical protein
MSSFTASPEGSCYMLSITFAFLGLMLYVGPDQILPFTSALAAVGGAIMIFWRQVKGAARRVFGLFRKQ